MYHLRLLNLLSYNYTDMKNDKKSMSYLKIAIISIIIILIAFTYWKPHVPLSLFFNDISQVEDQALELSSVSVPDEQNAYFDLKQISQQSDTLSQYRDPVESLLKKEGSWSGSKASIILDKTEPVIEAYSAAARHKQFQDPQFKNKQAVINAAKKEYQKTNNKSGSDLMDLNSIRMAAKLNSVRTKYLTKNKQYSDAIESALVNIKVGEKIMESQSLMLYFLVGIAIHERGLESLKDILATDNKQPEKLRLAAEKLKQTSISGLSASYKIAYHNLATGIDFIEENGYQSIFGSANNSRLPSSIKSVVQKEFYFQPKRTKQKMANNFNKLIKKVESGCSPNITNPEQNKKYRTLPDEEWRLAFTPNYVGKVLMSNLNAFNGVAIDNACEHLIKTQEVLSQIDR